MTRTKALCVALLLSLAASTCHTSPPDALAIRGELTVPAYRLVRLSAGGVATDSGLIWVYDELKLDGVEVGGSLYLTGPPGTYAVQLRAISVSKEGKVSTTKASVTLVIKGKDEPPPGPTPTPDPTPGEAPIAGAGLRVLVVYESGELQKLPAKQLAVIYSKPLRTWLDAKCADGPDSKTREWRMYDQNADLSAEAKTWQDAMKRPRKSVPWIVISNGKTGFEGPLPADLEKTLELLKKHAGD